MTQALVNSSVDLVPHATTDIPTGPCQGIVATGVGGTCTLVHENGSTTQLTLTVGVPVLNIRFKRVNAIGTVATTLKGFYFY